MLWWCVCNPFCTSHQLGHSKSSTHLHPMAVSSNGASLPALSATQPWSSPGRAPVISQHIATLQAALASLQSSLCGASPGSRHSATIAVTKHGTGGVGLGCSNSSATAGKHRNAAAASVRGVSPGRPVSAVGSGVVELHLEAGTACASRSMAPLPAGFLQVQGRALLQQQAAKLQAEQALEELLAIEQYERGDWGVRTCGAWQGPMSRASHQPMLS